MILQIAGTRTFDDIELFYRIISKVKTPITEIVTGMARGADYFGYEYALANNIIIKQFFADWDKYGKSAGMIRNKQMVEYLKANNGKSLIFWDGKSKGAKNMIGLCKKYNIVYKVIFYE